MSVVRGCAETMTDCDTADPEDPRPLVFICGYCGAEIDSSPGMMYCSEVCRRAAWQEARADLSGLPEWPPIFGPSDITPPPNVRRWTPDKMSERIAESRTTLNTTE